MKNYFILLLLAVFFACKNDPSQQNADGEAGNLIQQTSVLLLCQPVAQASDGADAPAHEVFLQLADTKVKVADILNCETLSPDQYEQYQVPKQAITAVGGWWAGAGDYIYVVEENGQYVVKQGAMFEEKTENNYDYKVVAKYAKNGEQVFE